MTARVEMKREILILWRMELHTESMCEQRLVELDVQFVTLNGSIMGESEGLSNQLCIELKILRAQCMVRYHTPTMSFFPNTMESHLIFL